MNNSLYQNTVFKNSNELPSLDGIREAHRLIQGYIKETPLTRSEWLSEVFDADVWIKNETVSPIACFKIRGALTEMLRSSGQETVHGVVTSSTGNHGLGVAYAASLLNIPAHIFLPEEANPLKRRAIQRLKASIHEYGHDLDDAKGEARKFCSSRKYKFIDDGESLSVMEGAGTIGLEIAQSLEKIDAVFVPLGSGSLASGVGAAIKSLQPDAKVIAVQSAGSPAMVKSFCAQRFISHEINTIAEGLVCREPALRALRGMMTFIDEAELVSDEELLGSVTALAEFAHVLVEPSGAAAFAGAWKRRRDVVGKRIVMVLTGANISIDVLQKALSFHLSPGFHDSSQDSTTNNILH
jgi:threonine dehydratase